jgi:hypothetical protein
MRYRLLPQDLGPLLQLPAVGGVIINAHGDFPDKG